jgi:hypothetical protein
LGFAKVIGYAFSRTYGSLLGENARYPELLSRAFRAKIRGKLCQQWLAPGLAQLALTQRTASLNIPTEDMATPGLPNTNHFLSYRELNAVS